MAYAARDAQVSVALFLHLLDLLPEAGPASTSGSSYGELATRCQGLVDVPFRGRVDGDDGDKRRKNRKQQPPPLLAAESPDSGDQQVPDPRRNSRRKPLGVGYSARWGCQTAQSFFIDSRIKWPQNEDKNVFCLLFFHKVNICFSYFLFICLSYVFIF